tara:strand:+ start:246 stop:2093 length:1848 start_codon:yes stop_codon:yes gene_type:complete
MKFICNEKDIGQGSCLNIDNKHYYITRENNTVRLFSLICPHMGGTVELKNDFLICPLHKWKFNKEDGKSVVGSKDLQEIPVSIKNKKVYAKIEDTLEKELVVQRWKNRRRKNKKNIPVDIQLIAHACLKIQHNNFCLITDPWLDGPAFHGAWIQYPKPAMEVKNLNADAILITHEHSDHLHKNTLKQFDKNIPIYFPAFPNQRIDTILKNMGFKNRHPMIFGKTYQMHKKIKITCYDPTSNWNDSIQLIDIEGWRFLNINDAGINYRIAKEVLPVDLIASSFSSGASGYPLCWNHLSLKDSNKILKDQFDAKCDMLENASEVYKCNRILLFASYFALWHPDHKKYMNKLMKYKVKPNAIRKRLAKKNIDILDVLPGDYWSNLDKKIKRLNINSDDPFSKETTNTFLEEIFDENIMNDFYPSGYNYKRKEIISYFLNLKNVPEFNYVKEYKFTVHIIDSDLDEDLHFCIKDNDIIVVPHETGRNLKINIPLSMLMHLINYNLSWDEIYIGYWCTFDDEDPYNVAFWRLLQAPYYIKPHLKPLKKKNVVIEGDTPIGMILEKYGDLTRRVMTRHGLYCVGCDRIHEETITEGSIKHGLSKNDLNDILNDLNRVVGSI